MESDRNVDLATDRLRQIASILIGLALVWRFTGIVEDGLAVDAERGWTLLSSVPFLLEFLGLVFLACGILAVRTIRTPAASLFASYCACSAIHWGGPIAVFDGILDTTTAVLYLIVSSILAHCYLLHFALAYPRPVSALSRSATTPLLYAPVAIAFLLGLGVIVSPAESSTFESFGALLIILNLVQSNGYAVAALVVIIVRTVRFDTADRVKFGTAVMAVGLLLGWLPYVVMSIITGATGAQPLGEAQPDLLNLPFVLIPLAFLYALLRGRDSLSSVMQ